MNIIYATLQFILTASLLTILLLISFKSGYEIGRESRKLEANSKIAMALKLGMNESNK